MGLDAFDEFDEIEISDTESKPQAAETQSAETQSAETAAAETPGAGGPTVGASAMVNEVDEDLFAFPAPDLSHVEPALPVVSTTPMATADSAAPDPEPVPAAVAATPAPAPIPVPAAAAAPASVLPSVTASASPAPVAESDLDDDLFQFPDVFSGALLATPVDDAAHVSVQSDTFVVDDPTPEPVAQAPQSAPAQQVAPEPQTLQPQSPPVAAAPAPAPAATTAHRAPAEPTFDPTPKYQGYQPYVPPTDEELAAIAVPAAGRSHLTEILAVGFLVLNVALVLFAYQANASFHDTLTEVTRSVAQTLTNNQARAQERPPTITFPLPPLTQDPANQLPGQALDLRLQSMALARRMVEEERYFDARRVLYRLLANRDLAVLETSFVAEAEFMIAESYELQGKALAEVQR